MTGLNGWPIVIGLETDAMTARRSCVAGGLTVRSRSSHEAVPAQGRIHTACDHC